MSPQITYNDCSLALAKLLNQDSIPSSESSRVAFFIAAGIQRTLRAFDWQNAIMYASKTTDTNGRVSLSDLALGQAPGFVVVTNGVQEFTNVIPSIRFSYTQGNFYYNVVLEAGDWVLYSSEPNATITIGYYGTPDTVDTLVTIAFQPMVIAKAALIYYRQAQDPEADTSLEEDQYRQKIAELAEQQERRRPQRIAYSRRDLYGGSLGRTMHARYDKVFFNTLYQGLII